MKKFSDIYIQMLFGDGISVQFEFVLFSSFLDNHCPDVVRNFETNDVIAVVTGKGFLFTGVTYGV